MNWFTRRKIRKETAIRLYEGAVQSARHPAFYEAMGVADTIDGRFDMLSLHVILLMDRLNTLGPEGQKLAQALFDRMFKMIDLTLREMGIGDMGIPKHMKKMMKAFNGRAHSYHQALASRDRAQVAHAISRNVFRIENGPDNEYAKILADFVIEMHRAFGHLTLTDFEPGIVWSSPCKAARTESLHA